MLPKIKLPHEAFATVTLVSGSRTGNRRPAVGEPTRRGFANHGIEADALNAQLAGIECLAGGKESGVRVRAVGEPRLAVIRTDQRRGVARTVVVRVPHHLDAELVVSHLTKDVAIAHWNEVVELVNAAVTREREDTLLRKQVVEFELAQLQVQPRLPNRLSSRAITVSKWKEAVSSEEGST